MITLIIFLGIIAIGIVAYLGMKATGALWAMMHMLMTAIGLLLVVVSVEMHPDLIRMELAMLMSIIGVILVYTPLINERKNDDDRDKY